MPGGLAFLKPPAQRWSPKPRFNGSIISCLLLLTPHDYNRWIPSPTEFVTEVRKMVSTVKGKAEPEKFQDSFWYISGEARKLLAAG